MTRAVCFAEIAELYASGRVLLVPQAYAAQVLRARLAGKASQLSQPGLNAWGEWVGQLWSNLLLAGVEDRILLNRLQEEQLWVRQLGRSGHGDSAPRLRELASMARSGFHLASAHNFLNRLRSEADTSDARTFAVWTGEFREQCERDRLLSPALVEAELAKHLQAGRFAAPRSLSLLGFSDLTPAQHTLLRALRNAGTEVEMLRPSAGRTCVRGARITLNEDDQLEQATLLVAQAVAGATTTANAVPTVAMIGENMEELGPELERSFRQVLTPKLQDIASDLSLKPWQFSSPPALAGLPLIADALSLLQWTAEPLPLERVGQLLRSPYFMHADSEEECATFEFKKLRQWPLVHPALNLSSFLRFASSPKAKPESLSLPELHRLGDLVASLDLARAKRTHAEWTDKIRQILREAGWPGPRELSRGEQQTADAWEGLLDQLATLQVFGERIGFATLLHLLTAQAQQRSGPLLDTSAPVHVLSLGESPGLAFDHVILLNARDTSLPRLQPLHPLLPRALQRAAGLADVQGAVSRSRQQLEDLATASLSVTLLCPREDSFGEVTFSPLARELGFEPEASPLVMGEEDSPVRLEHTPEAALPALPSRTTHGGADILRLQAACGFQAYATFRLAARAPEFRGLGFDHREIGQLLHHALQSLWAELGSQDRLRSLSAEMRERVITEATRSALAKLQARDAGVPWVDRYLAILQKRFVQLLGQWLDVELVRAPFHVLAQETEQTLTLGPLSLSMRFDRVDEVEGGYVLVDYKTSSGLSTKSWLEPRPDQPQLPAYALSVDPDQLRGIAFGRVRRGKEMGWISLSDNAELFPRKRGGNRDMQLQVEAWREELTALAEAFAGGDIRVDPKKYPGTCQYCAYRALCRLDPATLLISEEIQELDEANFG